MAFNPTLPVEDTELDAAQMRNQFNGLKTLIDDLPLSGVMQDMLAARTAGQCPDVAELNLTVSNTYSRAEVQAIADKLDELLYLLKRE